MIIAIKDLVEGKIDKLEKNLPERTDMQER